MFEDIDSSRDLLFLAQARLLEHATRAELLVEHPLDATGVLRAVCRHSRKRPRIAYSTVKKS